MTPGNEFKHKVEIPKRFMRSFKPLSEEMKQRVMEKIQELAMGHITGKSLVGKYKNLKRIRLGKYRLIYGEKPCVIYLYDIKPRETAYI